MVDKFYITLPSNSSVLNSMSNFETLLPNHIKLDGNWEVGLAEIIYTNTWNNVSKNQNKIYFYNKTEFVTKVVEIPAKRYQTIQELITSINQVIPNDLANIKCDDATG